LLGTALLILAGNPVLGQEMHSTPVLSQLLTQEIPTGPPCPVGVVFVADGSGNLHRTFDSLTKAIADAKLPLCVERVDWSHGSCRIFSDLHGHSHQRAKGKSLADQVCAYRAAHPGNRVCLVGHSAGAAIVLAAAECLPPGSVDRIVLLAPAVSPTYDLRPALACACEGIDSFHSYHDCISVLLAAVGTADGCWRCSAGRGGFRIASTCPADTELYQKLRQCPWHRAFGEVGHHGGHFGWCGCEFVRACVLPLLSGAPHGPSHPPLPSSH
jgi:pimeloyl-ACP methyl ester carboxylesterase